MNIKQLPGPGGTTAKFEEVTALMAVAFTLGVDEVRVLGSIARRLRVGMRVYGRLRLEKDERDFGGKEAREELEDFLVYAACGWLKKQAQRAV